MASGYAIVVFTCVLLPATLCQRENRTCFCGSDGYNHTCDFSGVFCSTLDNNCNKENVALGKTVNISSSYRLFKNATAEGCLAVNGNSGTTYHHYYGSNPNCHHSGDDDFVPFWEVFLERNYSISEITIYGRQYYNSRMLNVIVSVDNKDCYHFPVGLNASGIRERTDVVCTPVLRGSRVKIRKLDIGERSLPYLYINICEVQVWVCKSGLYGANCDKSCNAQCKNCDNYDGSCRDGCEPGYFGIYCQIRCGNCKEPSCDQLSGACKKGCDKGWHGEGCTRACAAGFHGYDCAQKCGTCSGGQVCSRITGLCAAGCDPGWKGASCSDMCETGTWGPACKNKCANCADETVCDNVDGTCPLGCKAGFGDLKCTEACKAGTYGPNCENACGGCRKSTTCDSKSGVCLGGCDHGWMSEFCTQPCPLKNYGEDCKLNCSNCVEGQACDRVTGECREGCKAGWISAFCNETCPLGTYGENCSEECGQCKDMKCHTQSGVCLTECNPGYKGPYCKDIEKDETPESDKLPLGLIVAVIIAGCALLLLVIVLVLCAARKRRENEEAERLNKLEEVEIIQQEAPVVAGGTEFQEGLKNDQTEAPQPESPAAETEIKTSEDQGVKEKPEMPKPKAGQESSGGTAESQETSGESESEDE